MNRKYFAFISYQRKDEKLAEWLRGKLESYHLPAKIRKGNVGLPKDLRPIFRDSLELSGGFLAQEIEKALSDSRYLIVVCSPNSAQSPWVNKEVQYFIDHGREDCIIPYIVDGAPFSGDESTECFSPALRSLQGEKEILGININELGRDASAIKVVARMFGLSFDTLWQRHNREQKRKRIVWAIIAVLLVLASLLISGYFFKVNREIEQKNKEILEQSREIEEKSDEISRKNIEVTQKNEEIAGQYREIEQKNQEITQRNEEILRGRDKLLISQSKYLVTEAKKEFEKGNVTKALRMALYALPKNLNNPDRPYIAEAEAMLRECHLKIVNPTREFYSKHNLIHDSYINTADISPDGRFIVTASSDNSMCIWDINTGKAVTDKLWHKNGIQTASFSPCGKYIVTASYDKTAQLWNAATGKPAAKPMQHESSVNSAAFSSNGKYIVTASDDGTAQVWDVQTAKPATAPFAHGKPVKSAQFSHNGKYIITVSDYGKQVNIWNIETHKPLIEPLKFESFATSLQISPDDKYIAVYYNKVTEVYCIETGEQKASIKHENHISTVCFSPDSKNIVTLSSNKCDITTLDETGKSAPRDIIVGYNYIYDIKFSSDGKYIIASCYSERKIIDVATGKDVTYLVKNESMYLPEYFTSSISIVGERANVMCAEWFKPSMLINKDNDKSYISSSTYSPCGKYIAVIINNTSTKETVIHILDAVTFKPITAPLKHNNAVNATFSPNGRILFTSNFTVTQAWSTESGELVKGDIQSSYIKFSKDGSMFLAKNNLYQIEVMDTRNGKLVAGPFKGFVNSAEFSPNGKYIVATTNDSTAVVWNIATGKQELEPFRHNSAVKYAQFSPCGTYVITSCYDRNTYIWNIKTNKIEWSILHDDKVKHAVFSPDGKYILTTSNGDMCYNVWDLQKRKNICSIKGFGNIAVFSPDGKSILALEGAKLFTLPFQPLQELIDKYRKDSEHDWSLSKEEKDEYSLE